MSVVVEPGVDVFGLTSRDFFTNLSFRIVHLPPRCDAARDLVAEVDAGVEASAPIRVQVQAGSPIPAVPDRNVPGRSIRFRDSLPDLERSYGCLACLPGSTNLAGRNLANRKRAGRDLAVRTNK